MFVNMTVGMILGKMIVGRMTVDKTSVDRMTADMLPPPFRFKNCFIFSLPSLFFISGSSIYPNCLS
jgi:hypothetical protein